jgi:hypothetical protein
LSSYGKILAIDNEIEAQRFGMILEEEQIPHRIVSYHDTAYDGLFQAQLGWGHLEAADEYRERIIELYDEMKKEQGE